MTVDVAAALVDGLLRGAVYALVSVGFTLIYDVLHVVNLAHGSLLMVAMMLAWVLAAKLGIDPYASLPLITLVMFAAGWALCAGLIQPVSRGRSWVATLMTFGIAVVLEMLVLAVFGVAPRTLRTPYGLSTVPLGPVVVGVPRLAGAAVAALLGGMLWVFMTRTDTGRSIRAVAREPVAACLVGIRPARMRALAYGAGAACLGGAGCLLLPSVAVSPQVGPLYLLVGLAGAILGGLGRMPGAIVGGLVVGVVESGGALWLGDGGGGVGVVGVMLAALVLRGRRLLGGRA